ncbi:MAG: hypothetical protein NTV57_00005, partial [Cyanobacteria bacterium]|nr:hypothetical protein [Cyanobacteriota bacterium]
MVNDPIGNVSGIDHQNMNAELLANAPTSSHESIGLMPKFCIVANSKIPVMAAESEISICAAMPWLDASLASRPPTGKKINGKMYPFRGRDVPPRECTPDRSTPSGQRSRAALAAELRYPVVKKALRHRG